MPLQDYYNTDDDYDFELYDIFWGAQTFTPDENYSIGSVKLLLYRLNSPGLITVTIETVDESGKPSGNILCSGTTDGDTLPTGSPYEWREITFSSSYALSQGVQYAIVVKASEADGESSLIWRVDASSSQYSGGMLGYKDGGNPWQMYSDCDGLFECWSSTANYEDLEAVGGGTGDGTAVLSIVIFKNLKATGGSVAGANAKMLSRVTMSDVVQRKRVVAVGNNQVWCGDVE